MDGTVPDDLPAEVAAAVYFTCVEALQNAAKHARAHTIRVQVTGTDRALAFEVVDDGVGFDPATARRGSGLGNLADRLVILGGDVTVESAPGAGTAVRGRLPLPSAAPPAGVRRPQPEPA